MTTSHHHGTFEETRYAPVFRVQGQSPTLRAIWREAYGDEYSGEVEPLGFSTLSDLASIADALAVGPGARFLDAGCGRGGPGLWVARRTGADVVGIDITEEAVEAARERAAQFGLADRCTYEIASMTDIPLPAEAVDGAVTIDALWMVLDKPAAVAECARVLRSGATWAFLTWQPTYFRYEDLVRDAGLEVVAQEELLGWQTRQLAVYEGILRERERLLDELGEPATTVLLDEAASVPEFLGDFRRLLVVARRP